MEQEVKKRDALRKWVKMKAVALQKVSDSDSPSKSAINRALAEFDEKMREHDELQSLIEESKIDDEAAFDAETSSNVLFREDACAHRDKAADLLISLHEQGSARSEASSSSSSALRVRLPKLNLPKFSGNILDFQTFWDNFKVYVHENDEIPVVSKFTYFTSLLKGDAKRVISGLAMTVANYPIEGPLPFFGNWSDDEEPSVSLTTMWKYMNSRT